MSFSTATILSGPTCEDDGGGVLVWWEASNPDGSVIFQLYVDRALTWHGTDRQVTLPPSIGRAIYQVGTVGPGEGNTDFSASLPLIQGTGDKALLDWLGGTWEEPSPPGSGLAGFRVYGESTPGGGINYATPLDTVAAYIPGLETDGYGYGGYGDGGYGYASGHYWWKSNPLTNGTWHFGVKPHDNAGNEGLTQEYAVTISRPPEPPARDPDSGLRLTLTYSAGTGKATLDWLASPG